MGGFAAIYSYSKTQGLFAGVSIKGTVILERKEANANFYHCKVLAKDILDGRVPPPLSSEDLYHALIRQVESGAMYSNINEVYQSPGSRFLQFTMKGTKNNYNKHDNDSENDQDHVSRRDLDNTRASQDYSSQLDQDYKIENNIFPLSAHTTRVPPSPPQRKGNHIIVVALFDFDAQRDGDLAFRKGDIIVIVEKSNS
ncbi:hypothetical protein HK096_011556 [Nowakowskiella sp. JEL0078]|nr:hypothetical protein HK096_011556 [Nowakowskiella sp. JEL0078]